MELKLTNKIIFDVTRGDLADAGLFMGNTGISLALYLLARKYHVTQAEIAADRLMRNVVQQMKHINSPAFDSGLSGIGWAINILHSNKCLKGDIDEILYNIDAVVYKELTRTGANNTIGLTNGLLGYFFYLIERLSNVSHNKCTVQHSLLVGSVQTIIDKLSDLMPDLFPTVSRDVYISILWDVPLVFIALARAYHLGIYQNKIRNMVKCWEVHIPSAVPYFATNKLYLAEALEYMNCELNEPYIAKHVDLLLHSLDISVIEEEIDYRVTNINEGWPFTVLLLYWANRLFDRKSFVQTHFDVVWGKILAENHARFQKELDSNNQTSLSFINGLCGIAVAYAIFPLAFNKQNI